LRVRVNACGKSGCLADCAKSGDWMTWESSNKIDPTVSEGGVRHWVHIEGGYALT